MAAVLLGVFAFQSDSLSRLRPKDGATTADERIEQADQVAVQSEIRGCFFYALARQQRFGLQRFAVLFRL